MENNDGHQPVMHCPFLNKECIQKKCALWTFIRQAVQGPLGVATVTQRGICALAALPMIMSAPKPQPVDLGKLTGKN